MDQWVKTPQTVCLDTSMVGNPWYWFTGKHHATDVIKVIGQDVYMNMVVRQCISYFISESIQNKHNNNY